MKRLLQFGRFSLVGVMNTAIDFLVFAALVYGLSVPPLAANAAGFAVALLNSFLMNRRFTFAEEARGGPAGAQFVRFAAVNLAALAISTAIIWRASPLIGPLPAKLAAIAINVAWTYALSRLFVFKASRESA